MNRRDVLLCGAGAILACSIAADPDLPDFVPDVRIEPEQVVLPSDPRLRVASWETWGGMADVKGDSPRLAVFADGTAIAHADRQLMLTSGELAELVATLRVGVARGSTSNLRCLGLDGSATDLLGAVPAKFPADLDGFIAQRVIVELAQAYSPHGGPMLDLMVPGRTYNLALGWRYRLPDE